MAEFESLELAKQFINTFETILKKNYEFEVFGQNDKVSFYVIDNEYVLVSLLGESFSYPKKYFAYIREITFNTKNYKIPMKGIESFKGLLYSFYGLDNNPILEHLIDYPRLKEIVNKKYNEWSGWQNNYIVVEMDNKNGEKAYGVGYCPYLPSKFLRNLDDSLYRNYCPENGFFSYDGKHPILNAYQSWKGEPYDKRFEKHARYYVVTATFKEKDDVINFGQELIKAAQNGAFKNEQAQTYIHPVNKWISEETLYHLVTKIYGKKNVIYQYRPSFLRSSKNGQMSYDIFIIDKNIAIEYQGKQHFEPVEIFGGEEAFRGVQQRDKEKKMLSEQNGKKLIYFYYYDILDESSVRDRIDNF